MKAIIPNLNDINAPLAFSDVEIPILKDHEVKIKVKAIGVNRADIMQRQGQYPPPQGESEILGLEVSGLICEVGKNTKKWKVGDEVFALLSSGGYAQYVNIHEDLIIKKPKNLSFITVAGVAETFITAYQTLFFIAKLKPNERILIHAGASGVGLSCILLSKHLSNNQIIITAGSDSKIEFCKNAGADFGINYKTQPEFSKLVKQFTHNKGVNVVVDFVGASFFEQNVSSLAIDGRWVLLGLLGGSKVDNVKLASLLMKRIHLMGSTLRARDLDYKSILIKEFVHKVMPLFEVEKINPIIDKVFPWHQVNEAHQYMIDNQNIGKIILEVDDY